MHLADRAKLRRSIALATAILAANALAAAGEECPPGALVQGEAPPAGREQLCIKPDGTPHGMWRTWYDSGRPMSEREMRDGEEHGIQRSWWPSGQPMMEGVSVRGDRYPGFKFWSVTGELTTLGSPDKPDAPSTPQPTP